jgi:hypothetical protein
MSSIQQLLRWLVNFRGYACGWNSQSALPLFKEKMIPVLSRCWGCFVLYSVSEINSTLVRVCVSLTGMTFKICCNMGENLVYISCAVVL